MFTSLNRRPSVFRPGAIAASSNRGRASVVDTTIFLALADDSGDTNLSETLSVNSVAPTAFLSFRGASASGATWTATAGPNLARGSTGTDPTTGRDLPVTKAGET